jgi:hypothetical protein
MSSKENTMANQSNGVSAISRVVLILEAFTYEAPFLSLSAIAARSGIPLSSAQRIVAELVRTTSLSGCRTAAIVSETASGRLAPGLPVHWGCEKSRFRICTRFSRESDSTPSW